MAQQNPDPNAVKQLSDDLETKLTTQLQYISNNIVSIVQTIVQGKGAPAEIQDARAVALLKDLVSLESATQTYRKFIEFVVETNVVREADLERK